MHRIDDETLARVRAEHAGKELHLLESGAVQVVVRKPSREDWKRFRREGRDEQAKEVAVDNLLRAVLVHPDLATFDRLQDALPALCEDLAEPVVALVGLTGAATAKKL